MARWWLRGGGGLSVDMREFYKTREGRQKGFQSWLLEEGIIFILYNKFDFKGETRYIHNKHYWNDCLDDCNLMLVKKKTN